MALSFNYIEHKKRKLNFNDLQTQISNLQSSTLDNGKIFVGNGSNVAVGQTPSGELTMNNTGAFTLNNDSVIAKTLTNFTSGAGTVTSSDSILSALQKINGNVAAMSGAFVYKGVIDASANPNYPAAVVGDVYKISVAGKIGGASGLTVEVGDTIYCNTNTGGGNHATAGSAFNILQYNIDINVMAGSGLGVSGAALVVNTDNSSIEVSSDTLQVKAAGVTNAMLAGSIADTKLNTISTANKVSGSALQLATSSGLEDSTGLKVKTDGSTLQINGSNQVEVKDAGVSYAKIQNVSATDKLLGRVSSGSGVIEEITCTAAGRALIDDADAAAQRSTLGLNNVDNTSDNTKKTVYNQYAIVTGSATPTKAQLSGKGVLGRITSTSQTITLPAVISTDDGLIFTISNALSSTNSVSVASADSYNVDGASTMSLAAGEMINLMYQHSSTEFVAV